LQDTVTTESSSSLKFFYVDTIAELPPNVTLETLVDFFYREMKPYQDTPEDVLRGLRYAFSKLPGKGGFLLLAVRGGELVGGLTMLRTGMEGYVPENILLFVAVRRDLRGQGVGGELVRRGIVQADGAVKLHVEHDNPARRLYLRMGFENKYLEMRYAK